MSVQSEIQKNIKKLIDEGKVIRAKQIEIKETNDYQWLLEAYQKDGCLIIDKIKSWYNVYSDYEVLAGEVDIELYQERDLNLVYYVNVTHKLVPKTPIVVIYHWWRGLNEKRFHYRLYIYYLSKWYTVKLIR